jgi:hypothetical protein
MYTKTKIFNLALNMMLLQREITNADTDQTKESKVLRTVWEPALFSALQEMDLDRTMVTAELELLLNDPNDLWKYAYKYPSNCARLRRIVSEYKKDDESTKIPLATGSIPPNVVIFTNEYQASVEYIPSDIPLSSLNAHAGLAIAARLAWLSAPLIIGKESKSIRKSCADDFTLFVLEAQELDKSENLTFDSPAMQSPFVRARLE